MKLSLRSREKNPTRLPAEADHDYTSVDKYHPKNRLAKISEYGQTTGKARKSPSVYGNYPGMKHD